MAVLNAFLYLRIFCTSSAPSLRLLLSLSLSSRLPSSLPPFSPLSGDPWKSACWKSHEKPRFAFAAGGKPHWQIAGAIRGDVRCKRSVFTNACGVLLAGLLLSLLLSATGNLTRDFRVTGGNTDHYATAELATPECPRQSRWPKTYPSGPRLLRIGLGYSMPPPPGIKPGSSA